MASAPFLAKAFFAFTIGKIAGILLKPDPTPLPDAKPPTHSARGEFLPLLVGKRRIGPLLGHFWNRYSQNESSSGGKGFGAQPNTQETWFESGWHPLCVGPCQGMSQIYHNGEPVLNRFIQGADSTLTESYVASGSLVEFGEGTSLEGSTFRIFWGEKDQPAPTTLNSDLEIADDCNWGYLTHVVLLDFRLGGFPVWGTMEYVVESRPFKLTYDTTSVSYAAEPISLSGGTLPWFQNGTGPLVEDLDTGWQDLLQAQDATPTVGPLIFIPWLASWDTTPAFVTGGRCRVRGQNTAILNREYDILSATNVGQPMINLLEDGPGDSIYGASDRDLLFDINFDPDFTNWTQPIDEPSFGETFRPLTVNKLTNNGLGAGQTDDNDGTFQVGVPAAFAPAQSLDPVDGELYQLQTSTDNQFCAIEWKIPDLDVANYGQGLTMWEVWVYDTEEIASLSGGMEIGFRSYGGNPSPPIGPPHPYQHKHTVFLKDLDNAATGSITFNDANGMYILEMGSGFGDAGNSGAVHNTDPNKSWHRLRLSYSTGSGPPGQFSGAFLHTRAFISLFGVGIGGGDSVFMFVPHSSGGIQASFQRYPGVLDNSAFNAARIELDTQGITELETGWNFEQGEIIPYVSSGGGPAGANGAHILYQLLFETHPHGAGLDVSNFDIPSLEVVATRLDPANEGLRTHMLALGGQDLSTSINKLLQDLGVVIGWDQELGKYRFSLIRKDLPNDPPLAISTDALASPYPEITTELFPRSDRVTFSYTAQELNFRTGTFSLGDDGTATFDNSANTEVANIVSAIDLDAAASIAQRREIEILNPPSVYSIKAGRWARKLYPGKRIKLNESATGVGENLRTISVTRKDNSPTVEVQAIADVYQEGGA